MLQRRKALGGFLPSRRTDAAPLPQPADKTYDVVRKGSGKQEVATTMAVVRILKELFARQGNRQAHRADHPRRGPYVRMDSWFPSLKIYNRNGQLYTSVDAELMLAYKESTVGQILHEGINEAGSTSSFTAVGTSYATHGEPMIPVYIFYSMFGFQRTGDGLWAAADQMARGFVLGATAGRTTLTGEGLQHADGHSLLLASTNPAAVSYDPSFSYEIAHIVKDGLRRMYGGTPGVDGFGGENIFYYLTVYNEPYQQPAEPENLDVEGLLKGIYLYKPAEGSGPRAQILVSGVTMPDGLRAQRLLADEWGVAADVWSVTSWGELRRDGVECEREALHNPGADAPTPYVTKALSQAQARSSPPPTGCARCRTRSVSGCPVPTRRSAPTGSASPTPARPRAASSTSTPSRSSSRCSPRWRSPARSTGRRPSRPQPGTGSTTCWPRRCRWRIPASPEPTG